MHGTHTHTQSHTHTHTHTHSSAHHHYHHHQRKKKCKQIYTEIVFILKKINSKTKTKINNTNIELFMHWSVSLVVLFNN